MGNGCNSSKRGTGRLRTVQIPKSTTRKFGCVVSFGTSKPEGMAVAAWRANSAVRVFATISLAAPTTTSQNSRVKKIGVSEIRKSAGHFSVSFTQGKRPEDLAGLKSELKRVRSSGCMALK